MFKYKILEKLFRAIQDISLNFPTFYYALERITKYIRILITY